MRAAGGQAGGATRSRLSAREREVGRLFAKGMIDKKIPATLGTVKSTVQTRT